MTFNCDKSMATEASVTVRLRKKGNNVKEEGKVT